MKTLRLMALLSGEREHSQLPALLVGQGPLDMLCHGQLAEGAVIAVPCLCVCGSSPVKLWVAARRKDTCRPEGPASGGFPDPCAQSWMTTRVLFLGSYHIPTGSQTGS